MEHGMTDIIIVPADIPDAEIIAAIEKECFSAPMTSEQIKNQITDIRYDIICAKGKSGEIIGYAGMYHVLDEGYITNVAVAASARRIHAADALMDELETISAVYGLSFITLEVRESNAPAVSLYEKHGFGRAGLRKDYYHTPRENAVIMTKILSEDKT